MRGFCFYTLQAFFMHGLLLGEQANLSLAEPSTLQITQDQIDFQSALDLFEARSYQEAKANFVALKGKIQLSKSPTDHLSSLCGFYEMECLRKLGDYDGLAAASRNFDKSRLTRNSQLLQIEIHQLCELVRLEDWQALDGKIPSFSDKNPPASLQAQIAYYHGIALEGLARIPAAIMAYQTALTADAAASDEIARLATLRLLAIYHADPEVQEALKNFGTPFQDESSQGTRDLREAGALARLFLLSLGGNALLPPVFEEFLAHAPTE